MRGEIRQEGKTARWWCFQPKFAPVVDGQGIRLATFDSHGRRDEIASRHNELRLSCLVGPYQDLFAIALQATGLEHEIRFHLMGRGISHLSPNPEFVGARGGSASIGQGQVSRSVGALGLGVPHDT